jgi:hypothetical protein
MKTRRIIFLTAMTHAAIQACLDKLTQLMQQYRQIPNVPSAWLDRVHTEHVVQGTQHRGPESNLQDAYIYAGTVYQVRNTVYVHCFKICWSSYRSSYITSANGSLLKWTVSSLMKQDSWHSGQQRWFFARLLPGDESLSPEILNNLPLSSVLSIRSSSPDCSVPCLIV